LDDPPIRIRPIFPHRAGANFGQALDRDRDAKWTMSHAWRSQCWSTPRRGVRELIRQMRITMDELP